jgi:hypothetical protein
MPPSEDDRERFEALKDAMADTYATGPTHARRQKSPQAKRVFYVAIAGCALVILALAGAMIAQWRSATQIKTETQQPQALPSAFAVVTLPPYKAPKHTPPPNTPPPRTPPPPTPKPTKHPTATPSPEPTATPSPAATASATSAPTASASPSPVPSAVAVIHNAFLLVTSNKQLKVGVKGSCGGLDRTVEVRGYPKGCTVFDADSTGPLANGRGTVLVVPVSTTEDVGDVKYGLLYVRTGDVEEPRFVGLIRGQGSGRVTVRLQHGRIMMQTGDSVAYFTFNGRRIVRAPE